MPMATWVSRVYAFGAIALFVGTIGVSRAQEKTDILGFQIGVTVNEIKAKAHTDKLICAEPTDQSPGSYRGASTVERGTIRCHTLEPIYDRGSKYSSGVFVFYITENLEPNVAYKIEYYFMTKSDIRDLVGSVAKQYNPKRIIPHPFDVAMVLNNDLVVEITNQVNSVLNGKITLAKDKIRELDLRAGEEKRRGANPPPKF
jgi:hypothetical protein